MKKVVRRTNDNTLSFDREKHSSIRGERYAPYPSKHQVLEQAAHGGDHGERFDDLYLQDFVLAGRSRADWSQEDTQMSTFQRALVERGMDAARSEDEDVPLGCGVSMTYSAVMGLEIFREIESLEDKERISSKKVRVISSPFCQEVDVSS